MGGLQDIVDELCREAGWRPRRLSEDGPVTLELEGGLSFEVSLLPPGLALFRSRLADLPADEAEADRFCRRLGQMAAASFKKRRSIVSVKGSSAHLHVTADSRLVPPGEMPGLCRGFLNDCDWWLKNIHDRPGGSGAGGFPNFGVRL